jgi:hypothetical protein
LCKDIKGKKVAKWFKKILQRRMIMFPAARIMDPITHDQTVPSGLIGPPMPGRLLDVMIEGLPAARWIVDMAACGVFLGDAKLVGARTVLIGG